MVDDRTSGMSEALRLTRAGQLSEAFAVMQRSLGEGSTVPAATSFARPRRIDKGLLDKLRGALSAQPGVGLGGLVGNLPAGGRGGARAGAAEAAAAPGGEIRHLSH